MGARAAVLCCLLALGWCGAALSEEAAVAEQAAEQTYTLDFPGGTPEELARALEEATGCYVVVSPAMTRRVGPIKLEDTSLTSFLAEVMRRGFVVILRGYVFREEKQELGPEAAPAEKELKERELIPRERERIKPISLDKIKPIDFLAKFSEQVHVPVVLECELPEKTIAVRLTNERVHEVFEKLGKLLGVKALRVYIVADADEASMRQYFENMTNEELYQRTKRTLSEAARLTSEQRLGFLRMAYDRFRQMPAQRRLTTVAVMSRIIRMSLRRLGQLDPQQQQELLALSEGLLNDLRDFFNSLPPQGRAELRPIFNALEEGLGRKIL